MIGLNDTQLNHGRGAHAPCERDIYLQRIAAMLAPRGCGHFGDSDVQEMTSLALCGLVHTDAARAGEILSIVTLGVTYSCRCPSLQ